MILILIKHKANSAHGGQQENLITADRILCAMVLVTNYLSRISISIDLCIYSFSFRSLRRKNRCHSANKCVCIWGFNQRPLTVTVMNGGPLLAFFAKNKSEKVTLRPKTCKKFLCWFLAAWVLFLGNHISFILFSYLSVWPCPVSVSQ